MPNIRRVYDRKNPISEKFCWGHSYTEAPKQLVILCHGFRNDGRNMYQLANSWVDQLPNTAFVAPTAPFRRITGLRGFAKFLPIKIKADGFVWYQIDGLPLSAHVPGVRVAAEILNDFIDAELRAFSLPPDAYALVGFSQGAIIALDAGLRRPVAPKALIAISGAIMNCEALAKEIENCSPTLLIHSEDDKLIRIEAVREVEKTLKGLGVPVKAIYRRSMAHDDFKVLPHQAFVDFLSKAFS